MSGSINYGRMDEYLGDLYASYLDAKRITEEGGIAMLSSLWNLMDSYLIVIINNNANVTMGEHTPATSLVIGNLSMEENGRLLNFKSLAGTLPYLAQEKNYEVRKGFQSPSRRAL